MMAMTATTLPMDGSWLFALGGLLAFTVLVVWMATLPADEKGVAVEAGALQTCQSRQIWASPSSREAEAADAAAGVSLARHEETPLQRAPSREWLPPATVSSWSSCEWGRGSTPEEWRAGQRRAQSAHPLQVRRKVLTDGVLRLQTLTLQVANMPPDTILN